MISLKEVNEPQEDVKNLKIDKAVEDIETPEEEYERQLKKEEN